MGKTADDLRYDLEQQREMLSRDFVAIGDRVSPGRMVERRRSAVRASFGRARDAVMGAKDSAASGAHHGMESAASTVGDASSMVGDAAAKVGDVVSSTPQAIQAQTQGNPLAAGLIAFGVGALAGSMLPTTRSEQQAVARVEPALESAASELGQGAQALAETTKQQVGEAAEHLQTTAHEAAQNVQAEAQHAAQPVKVDAERAGSETPDQPRR